MQYWGMTLISAFDIYCLSSKRLLDWEFLYFATCFVGIQRNLLFSYSFTLLWLLCSRWAIFYCWQIAQLHCGCLSHRECFIWVKIPGQKVESQLTSPTPALLVWHSTLFHAIRVGFVWKLYYKASRRWLLQVKLREPFVPIWCIFAPYLELRFFPITAVYWITKMNHICFFAQCKNWLQL